jgi:hypothetical protein
MSRLLSPYESIRVPAGVYVKSDDLSTVVDPIDCGRADALGIDRRKVSLKMKQWVRPEASMTAAVISMLDTVVAAVGKKQHLVFESVGA